MKREKQSCCFCSNIVSKGNIVNFHILNVLKFLIENIETSTLENSTVCDGCLNKIAETCEYKSRNSIKMLAGIKKEIDYENRICQKCEKLCEQEDTFLLVDCVTQVNWSDFVNYLFVDQDSQSLTSLQICGSCRISVSNIQDFLKLIYVYDQSKMKCDTDNCDDLNTTGNSNLVQDKVEIKQEFDNFIVDDKTEIKNVIEDNKTEILYSDSKGDSDCISYSDFKCKNEEVELKLEYDDVSDNQSTDRYGKVDDKEMTLNKDSGMISYNKEEKKQEVNCQGCNRSKLDEKVYNNIQNLKCALCLNSQKNFASKIHECDKCSYEITNKTHSVINKSKHGIEVEEFEKQKCQHYIYEAHDKSNLIKHTNMHDNIQNFKCTLCSNNFTQRKDLDNHLLKVHKSKNKIHACDKCTYSTTDKSNLRKHKLTHGIKIGHETYKCHNCIYETYNKSYLIKHLKVHNSIKDFKCILCPKNFTNRRYLDDHLLKIHKNKDNITSKIHECDKCNYETINTNHLIMHKLKHGVKLEGLEIYKCQHCVYETYIKSHLIRHIKSHNNIRDFQCTFCLKKFTDRKHLDDHLLKIHKSKDNVTSKIHECDNCNYRTTNKTHWVIHKLKHGIEVEGFEKQKCQYCIYVAHDQSNLIKHMKTHNDIQDFKSTLCSNNFTQEKGLDNHLESKNVYSTTKKPNVTKHKLKVGHETYKCHSCIYETYNRRYLIRHLKVHNNIRDFKCILCPKNFTSRRSLDDHLLKIHKSKDNVTSKIHACDKCSYSTTNSGQLLIHKLKHSTDVGLMKPITKVI